MIHIQDINNDSCSRDDEGNNDDKMIWDDGKNELKTQWKLNNF